MKLIGVFFLALFSFSLSARVISVDVDVDHSIYKKKWTSTGRTQEESLKLLFTLLKKTETGAKIVSRAEKLATERQTDLLKLVEASSTSRCDSTLVRRFAKSEPDRVSFDLHTKIYLSSDLSLYDAILDLSHELTHYVFRKTFNPYSDEFSLENYIKATVDGRGGEVDAYIVECRVSDELFQDTELRKRSYCHLVKGEDGKYSHQMAAQQFYRIGEGYSNFIKEVNVDEFPFASNRSPLLLSSVSDMAYPVSAISEFKSISERVCHNEWRRLSYIKEKNGGRMPASVTSLSSFDKRCKSFIEGAY